MRSGAARDVWPEEPDRARTLRLSFEVRYALGVVLGVSGGVVGVGGGIVGEVKQFTDGYLQGKDHLNIITHNAKCVTSPHEFHPCCVDDLLRDIGQIPTSLGVFADTQRVCATFECKLTPRKKSCLTLFKNQIR